MKKMAKVLLVICSLILGLCLCGCTEMKETVETTGIVERPEYFWNEEEIDGIIHVSTNEPYKYNLLCMELQADDNCEIIDEKEEFNVETREWALDVWYREYPVEEISRYSVRAYESFEEYEADSVLREELETGKYEIWGETISDSGKYELVLKETFEAMQSKEAEDEYTFTVHESDGYLSIVKWLLEEVGYDIVDIDVPNVDTYDITYKKVDGTSDTPTSNAQYTYGRCRCTEQEVEELRTQFLESGYEIIAESADIVVGRYLITYRALQQ